MKEETQLGKMVHIYNPSTEEVNAGGDCRKLKANPGNSKMRLSQKGASRMAQRRYLPLSLSLRPKTQSVAHTEMRK